MVSPVKKSKIIVLGEERVGKTSLTLKFVKGTFDDNQSISIACQDYTKKIDSNGE